MEPVAQIAADMIVARLADANGLTKKLTARAETLARAHVEFRLLSKKQDSRRWRRPGLLWPLFTKD